MVCTSLVLLNFPELTSQDALSSKMVPPFNTKPYDDFMTFFISLVDHPLRLLYLRLVSKDPTA